MISFDQTDLDELRPYLNGPEVSSAIDRVANHPAIGVIATKVFPGVPPSHLSSLVASTKTIEEFQAKIISQAVDAILKKSSGGLSISGTENLRKDRCYLFISNHRDIVCDPTFLTNALHKSGYRTPQICLGDNLLLNQLILDLVKLNKGVTVKRNLSARELLKWSHVLSAHISAQISKNTESVWIAQREGRAKDGIDETNPGLIKMLTLATEGDFLDRVAMLHFVPIAISYEYDPCDALKARELWVTETQGTYQKAPGEDAGSMMLGIEGSKGRIHIAICKELDLADVRAIDGKREQLEAVAKSIDHAIQSGYRCWPTNLIANDILEGRASDDKAARTSFENRIESQLDGIKAAGEARAGIRQKLLEGYANPVRSQLKAGASR